MNVNLCGTSKTFTALPSTIFGLYFNLSAALDAALLNIEHFLYSVAGLVGSPQNPSSGTTSSTVPVSVIVKATIEYP